MQKNQTIRDPKNKTWDVKKNKDKLIYKKNNCQIYKGDYYEYQQGQKRSQAEHHHVVVKEYEKFDIIPQEIDNILLRLSPSQTKFIVKLYQTYKTKEIYYQIYEYCQLQTFEVLFQKVKKKEVIISHLTKFILAYQLITALSILYQKGIIHNDLSLRNILFRYFSGLGNIKIYSLKLADFGQSKIINQNINYNDTFNITWKYSSPEKLNNCKDCPYKVDISSDIYSLGIILYQLFSGVHPFKKGIKYDGEQNHFSYYRSFLNKHPKPQKMVFQNSDGKMYEQQKEFIEQVIPSMLNYQKQKRPGIAQIFEKIRMTTQHIDKKVQKITMEKYNQIQYYYIKGHQNSSYKNQQQMVFLSTNSSQFESFKQQRQYKQLVQFIKESNLNLRKSKLFKQQILNKQAKQINKIVQQILTQRVISQEELDKLLKQLIQISFKILTKISVIQIQEKDLADIHILFNLHQINKIKEIKDKKQDVQIMDNQTLLKHIQQKMKIIFKFKTQPVLSLQQK